jgi:hypothetical protein
MYDAPQKRENVSRAEIPTRRNQRGSSEADADPSTTFHSGDRVRFAFESNIDGYLYVVQAGSSGRWTVLLPKPDANTGRNRGGAVRGVSRPRQRVVAFDETRGPKEVFVVLSKQPLETLPGFKTAVTRRENGRPIDRERSAGAHSSRATPPVRKGSVAAPMARRIR